MSSQTSSFPYDHTTCFSAVLGGRQIAVASKPGLPEWDVITPAAELLGKLVRPIPGENLLLLGCGHGALAVALAQQIAPGLVWATDDHILAIEMTSITAQANQVDNLRLLSQIDLPAELNEACPQVVMLLPKGRMLARRWLLQAWQALPTGGAFYLAGAKAEGVESTIKDAQALFGEGSILGYKKGNRCARFFKNQPPSQMPAWAELPGVKPGTWHTLDVHIDRQLLHLHTLPGVFSFGELDRGTQMLLQYLPDVAGETVLDIGCGYGILGLVAALKGAAHVTLADSSLLAAACARENLALHQVTNAEVVCADLFNFAHLAPYTLILTNPPFHSGHAVNYKITYALIRHAHEVLKPGGRLVLVSNRFTRYTYLLEENFGGFTTLAETGKFHILSAIRQP